MASRRPRRGQYAGRPTARRTSPRIPRVTAVSSTADSATATATPAKTPARRARSARYGRTMRAGAFAGALAVAGLMYSFAFPSASTAEDTTEASQSEQVLAGKAIYENSCITCHGANLQGVTDRGTSLIGVGGASVYFQVATGRMPVARQEAQPLRKAPKYNDEQTRQLAAYIQSVGGGPAIPTVTDEDLKEANLGEGGQLFRLNCASCHNTSGQGGALSSGKLAPTLKEATPVEIYSAMLVGPQNMPVFSPNQLTDAQKKEVIAYVMTLRKTTDPGGAGIGRIGPVSEGLVIWLVGLSAVLIATVWIAGKS